MKDIIIGIAVFIILLLFLPFLTVIMPFNVKQQNAGNAKALKTVQNIQTIVSGENKPKTMDDVFTIYNSETGKTEDVKAFDFICGVTAGEMPSEYDPEALKAQAVAAYSYCCYLREHAQSQSNIQNYTLDVTLKNTTQKSYITTGLNVAYYPKEKAQANWGSSFSARWSKIESAVQSVYGKAMFYNGEVTESSYCDMSSGITENCNDVWGGNLPYLVEVSSPGDKLQKDYVTHVTFKSQTFEQKVRQSVQGAKFTASPSVWLSDINRSKAGGIISAKLCGVTVSGRFIRSLFSLRSTNFDLTYKDRIFTFTVKGNGHGVGMSQCGAQYMALRGSSWEDILRWYYKGVTIGDYY